MGHHEEIKAARQTRLWVLNPASKSEFLQQAAHINSRHPNAGNF